ncbi:MAG: DNA mismatch repair endonuclease MutL [Planctomycetota bacterium]
MTIQVLPKILVDKIAAGEVIERPASVVKELVENSLDAGANRIHVELKKGGSTLIRVVDDGDGMDESDIALAFFSHATSKLEEEEDLFDIHTMGFRGEALSSIASISQSRIVSRRHDSDVGHEIQAEGGEIGDVKVCGAPPGTQVEVRNLFFNVPVRRKFLKTPATEMAHVTEAVTRLALAHPDVGFVLRHNEREVFNLPSAEDRARRLGEFFGREIADNIIPFSQRYPELEIEGYLLPPSVDRSNTTMQYTYVNKRYVREKTLMHAISEGYKGLMQRGRRPVCFLFLTVDPGDVDVNVHPTKVEIKFRRAGDIHSRVVSAMRKTLRQAKLTPQVNLSEPESQDVEQRSESIRNAISDFFSGKSNQNDAGSEGSANHWQLSETKGQQHHSTTAPSGRPEVHYGNTTQMLDSFIVEEVADGIRLIDQHALHERILYNQMKTSLQDGELNSQQLLVPDMVELSQSEFYIVMDLQNELKRFGMHIEAFGDTTIVVRSFPQVLGTFDGETFFRELMDDLEDNEQSRQVDGRLDDLLKIMACRGAVKAGDRLSPKQIQHILQQRDEDEQTDTCPHGRPTSLILSHQELNKEFGRE